MITLVTVLGGLMIYNVWLNLRTYDLLQQETELRLALLEYLRRIQP